MDLALGLVERRVVRGPAKRPLHDGPMGRAFLPGGPREGIGLDGEGQEPG